MKYVSTVAILLTSVLGIPAHADIYLGSTCAVYLDEPVNSSYEAKITYPGIFGEYVHKDVEFTSTSNPAEYVTQIDGFNVILRAGTHGFQSLEFYEKNENANEPVYECKLTKGSYSH